MILLIAHQLGHTAGLSPAVPSAPGALTRLRRRERSWTTRWRSFLVLVPRHV